MVMGRGRLQGVDRNKQPLEDEKRGRTYAAPGFEELSAAATLARSAKWRISAYIGSSNSCTTPGEHKERAILI